MPVTDVFALPYPGPFAPVNVSQFASLATAVDSDMQAMYNALTKEKQRPSVYVEAGSQAVPLATAVNVTFNASAIWDTTGAQYSSGTRTIVTLTPGLYHVNGLVRLPTGPTSVRAALVQNGSTTPFSRRLASQRIATGLYCMVSGELDFPSTGTLSLQVLYTGAGSVSLTSAWLQCAQIADT